MSRNRKKDAASEERSITTLSFNAICGVVMLLGVLTGGDVPVEVSGNHINLTVNTGVQNGYPQAPEQPISPCVASIKDDSGGAE